MSKEFQPIIVQGCLKVEAGGGLVDVSQKAYREPYERKLCLTPDITRAVANAMLKAADAAEGPKAAQPAKATGEQA